MDTIPERAVRVFKYATKHSQWKAAEKFGLTIESVARYCRTASPSKSKPHVCGKQELSINVDDRASHLPKVLVFDIETSPILARVWRLWDQNVGLNMIKEDWFILSYAAKWLGVDGVIYKDLRGVIEDGNDTSLLGGIWQLLNDADIVVTQNGNKFDIKKLNARFIMNGYQPPSKYKKWDSLIVAKSKFGFTSNKLEYMTDKLCTKYKKLKHGKFAGFELWKECLSDNPEAWEEMEKYNKYDVLSLEELYLMLAAWDDKHPNFNLYGDGGKHVCRCGSTRIQPHGYAYTNVSMFQKWRCADCGAETRGRTNLIDKEDRKYLHMNIS